MCRKNIWGNDGQKLPKSVEGHESTHPRSLINSKQDKFRDPYQDI